MRKVILVDDEPGVVEGLSVMIDWSAHGFAIAGTAEDGAEALELIKRNEPELVVTDIRMPVMDGLELIRAVRSTGARRPRFLILSGHRDFDYARQALTLGVEDYLLKPVFEETLSDALKKLTDELETSGAGEMPDVTIDLPAVFSGAAPVPNSFAALLNEPCVMVVGMLDDYVLHNASDRTAGDEQLRKFMARTIKLGKNVGVLHAGPGWAVSIVAASHVKRHYGCEQEYIRKLGSFISSRSGPTASFVTTHEFLGFEDAEEWWKRVPGLRDLCLFDAPSARLSAEDLWARSVHNETDRVQTSLDLIHSVSDNDHEAIVRNVAECEESVRSNNVEPSLTVNYLKKICFELHRLVTELRGNPANVDELSDLCRTDLSGVCMRTVFGMLTSAAKATAQYLQSLDGARPSERMQHVHQDLLRSFKEDVTIRELAERHGISSAYLGQLFRREYGESFKDYRNRLRVEEAARLLRKTDLRVYEVARAVGYQSTDYFERRFASFYGTTPSAYRAEIKRI